MCRLYGFRANQPTKVECTLIHAQNALLIQSRSDMRGLSHADGWGLGFYSNGVPSLVKRATPAYEDLHFPSTAERVYAHTVVAHVRRATVGEPAPDNTHPFFHGPWVFAHNGTLGGFREIEPRLRRETLPSLLAERHGSTDSEQAFLWLLSGMSRAGLDPQCRCSDLEALAGFTGEAIARLAELCESTKSRQTTRLNFLLTDGRVLLVSRWNNSLHWVERSGIRDCEICGIPHIHQEGEGSYKAAVVASEPISHENWREVPDRHLVVVDPEIEVQLRPIGTTTRTQDQQSAGRSAGAGEA